MRRLSSSCGSASAVGLLAAAALSQIPGPVGDQEFQRRRTAHWAWQPLATTAPPATGHPVDAFVDAALRRAGLARSPAAPLAAQLRRLWFDLAGLPPPPEAVARFVADGSDAAWEREVDALLASPHFGEVQARHWLDLVRYAETLGHESDFEVPNAWRYRDYVIRACDHDVPYDQFVREHLAGDLLAPPRRDAAGNNESVQATAAFWFVEQTHSPVDAQQHQADRIDNQLDVLGKAMLGLTVGCARCHDHKFDPISQRDYYALAGIFRSTKSFHDLEHVSKWFDRELATDDQIAARKQAERERDAAKAALDAATSAAITAQRATLVADSGRYLLAASELLPAAQLLQAEAAQATNLRIDSTQWGDADTTVLHTHQGGEQFAQWSFDVAQAGRWHLAVRYASAEERPMRLLLDGKVVAEQALGEKTGGWQPAHQRWHDAVAFDLAAGPHTLRAVGLKESVPHLDALFLSPEDARGSDLCAPIVRHVAALLAGRSRDAILTFWQTLAVGDVDGFASRATQAQGKGGLAAILLGGLPPESPRELAARLQTFFATAAAAADIAAERARKANAGKEDKPAVVHLDEPLLEAARALLFDAGGLFAVLPDTLRPWLPPATQTQLQQLSDAFAAKKAAVPAKAPMAMCVAEDAVKDLPVHLRGNHLTLAAETTPRGTPAVFASFVPNQAMPKQHSGRAELARWLFQPEQALAARVQANRLWQRAFGQGLVRSPSNFGRRGDRPAMPELLDWLADDLRQHGWSQKQLWRRILLSRTWQASCDTDDAVRLHDAENRLLTHHDRQRLPAEAIRDAMFAIAGTLDRTLGGTLLGTGDRGYVTNDQSSDAAKYDAPRRSLYLPIIRNAMFDLFAAFDYADPSVHLEQRPQSAVATQALFLMNAPMVRQQAAAFAARAEAAGGDDDARIDFLWREAFARAPSARERVAAQRWLAGARGGDHASAAFAGLAQALFASNEFVYID